MLIGYMKRLIVLLLKRLYLAVVSRKSALGSGRTLVYYPPFTDRAELEHHYHAAKYFLPADAGTRIVFSIAESLADDVRDMGRSPKPEYMGDCSWSDDLDISFAVAKSGDGLIALLFRHWPRHVFVWTTLKDDLVMRLAAAMGLVIAVDRFSTWGCYNYPDYRYLLVDDVELKIQRSASQEMFAGHVGSLPGYAKAYVFGTGPSIGAAYDYDFADGYRIVCNTMIKNKKLMDHIRPHFLVAGDAIYHFGISRYACQFRKDLEAFLTDHNCLLLIPERYYPNFIAHNAQLAKYTVPVPYTATSINLSMKSRFETQSVHNILNQLLLPLASSLCDDIYLLGFDGRNSNDKHFWASLESVNYEDLKGFHQEAHPGFFRGMDYQQYANIQAELAEAIMSLGESMGKKYGCLNESGNIALQRRFVDSGTR
jgi:hypothetical protein